LFLKKGSEQGAATMNGLKMLELQAEKAWEIWTTEENLWSV
jgi:shikimate dehydrogenase